MTRTFTETVLTHTGPLRGEFRQSRPWLEVVAHLDPKYGGMSSAVPALASAVSQAGGQRVSLAGFCAETEQYTPDTDSQLSVHHLPAGYGNWLKDKAARKRFHRLIASAAGVHIHGLWEQSTLLSASAARKAGKPYMVSAHGMLQPWALRNKRIKKIVYGAVIERYQLARAKCLHALTAAEVHDYRNYGLNNPIAIIPNGVEVPARANPGLFLTQFPELRGKRIVLFLSRIHFKKGLDILCQAWGNIAQVWPDAQLVLAGPDFEGTQASVEALVGQLNIRSKVTFTGMLDYRLKWSALSAADCFVLPSYSEGLSVSVLEAMGMGLPVIVTKHCNLPEVSQYKCGWVIEANVHELATALTECLGSSASRVAELGQNGRRLVERNYSWRVVGEQMSEVYGWLSGGAMPRSVAMDLGGRR